MAFAAGNAGHRVTLNLGILVLYRAPVTLVAFLGLLAGMLVMFAAGIHTDLKVRRILRERLAEEARQEQGWIDRNQRDLFAQDPEPGDGTASTPPSPSAQPVEPRMTPPPAPEVDGGGTVTRAKPDAEGVGAEEPVAGLVPGFPDEEEPALDLPSELPDQEETPPR
jgi:hypothetical protein